MKDYDPQEAVDYLIDNSRLYAQAESHKVYMEELRKTIKAECMKEAEMIGHKTAAMQEREAYASPKYKEHLWALSEAVQRREEARWMMIAAQERINVWRSQEASNRNMDKVMM
jgi:hypothetical protein